MGCTPRARVRGGDHVDYSPINRCARVRAAGHGGQVLLTRQRDLVAGRLGSGFGLKELGEFRLRDLAAPELIFQLPMPICKSISRRSARLRSVPAICRCR